MVHWKKGVRQQFIIPKVFYSTTCSRQMRVTIQVPKALFSIFTVTRPVTGDFDHHEILYIYIYIYFFFFY